MTIESALIPMPSEVTMPFSGFLVTTGKFHLLFVVVAGSLGNLLGSIIAYTLGFWGEELVIRNFIKKYGKYIFLSEHEYDRSERWFKKYGQMIVFISRLLPGIRTYISLPAGISHMNFFKFILYTALGSFIWSFILSYIGIIMGNNWNKIGSYFHMLDIVIIVIVGALLIYFIRKKLHGREKRPLA